jgi:hypothetical protein
MHGELNHRAMLMRPLFGKVLARVRAKKCKQLHYTERTYPRSAQFAAPLPVLPLLNTQAAATAAAEWQPAPRRAAAVLRNAACPGHAYRRAAPLANDSHATACFSAS